MNDVYIGKGNLTGKGVYAARDFEAGEVVISYNLTELSKEKYGSLPENEKMFTHTHHGKVMLYGEPERYVNHSDNPNTRQDLERGCDVAIRDIAKDEMITTDASKDDIE